MLHVESLVFVAYARAVRRSKVSILCGLFHHCNDVTSFSFVVDCNDVTSFSFVVEIIKGFNVNVKVFT